MSGKVWFITGASRGFGRVWARAALERGDRVAAGVRTVSALDELVERHGDAVLPLRLDVSDREAVHAAVAAAHRRFGRLDVVVNNAGYGLFGPVENVTEQQARDQMDTNFFGTLWVTQAVLPVLRAQRGGHIVQVSSIAGLASWPMLGLYHASKWAIEGMSDALAQEVSPFGVHVTLLEPGPYRTDWRGSSAVWAEPGEAYAESVRAMRDTSAGISPGDPEDTVKPLFDIVDAPHPPLRCLLGAWALDTVRKTYEERLRTWRRWDGAAGAAHGD
ncbi:SDR family NAD(P)-dependent oxidoreductase [Thermobifida halotolerans]|uniref:SDR family NAD(P)-dependent oxidoreductase n=1 Tax=Thermobifida halotolerans TaxID=483545 RepID=A0A399FX74_9ACTN|nr:SDR family NAD(P)-dependent oxidoreductase [Thermobifida halotolerans]UOE21267.1 SDR family NAD(P)-dependent oxidoreductase [Thermobifida halotolerans]